MRQGPSGDTGPAKAVVGRLVAQSAMVLRAQQPPDPNQEISPAKQHGATEATMQSPTTTCPQWGFARQLVLCCWLAARSTMPTAGQTVDPSSRQHLPHGTATVTEPWSGTLIAQPPPW